MPFKQGFGSRTGVMGGIAPSKIITFSLKRKEAIESSVPQKSKIIRDLSKNSNKLTFLVLNAKLSC